MGRLTGGLMCSGCGYEHSLPIEGLIESSNETAKVGKVTGVLADALNWAGIMEDKFNEQLEAAGSEGARNKLIMDTLSQTYDRAATAFYKNNQQIVNARRNQATLDEVTAKLGDTSALVKSRLWVMFGAAEDGTYRSGSALEWLNQKATQFSDWIAGLDIGALTTAFDQKFAGAVEKAGDAIQWCKENSDLLIGGLKLLAGAFVLVKIGQFNAGLTNGISAIGGFIGTVRAMTAATMAQAGASGTATAVQHGLNAALKANPIGFVITLIEAAIAAGVLLYQNWDKIKAAASQLWAKIKGVFSGIKNAIVGAFDSAKQRIAGFFSWIDDKIESIPLLGQIYKGNKKVVRGVVDWVGDRLGGNALGTSYWKGGPTWVNERGGEIMNLPNGTQIIPHDVSMRAARGPQVTVNVTVQGNVIGNRQYADEMGNIIVRRMLAAVENM